MTEVPNPELRTDEQPEAANLPQPVSEPTDAPIADPAPVAATSEPEIDYKAKFAESTREAQILAERLKALEQNPRKELTNEPTDSDLQTAFPEWDVMTDTERRIARRTFAAERIATSLHQKDQDREAQSRWNTDLELHIAANPSLQGKEAAFKEYANKPTHRGAPLGVLADAFLHRSTSVTTTPKPTPQPGLEPGNGGPRGPEKAKTISPEDLKVLRETDPAAHRQYVMTHDMSQLEL
jgi:hypothetical protein